MSTLLRRICLRAAPLAPLLFVLTAISWSEDAAPPPWILVRIDNVRSGMNADYEGLQKEISAGYKKSGVPFRSVMQATLGDLRQYVSVTPLNKFADMDGDSPLVKALGKDGYARITATAARLVESSQRLAARTMPEISLTTPMKTPPAFAVVIHYEVAPGQNAAFEALVKNDLLPAMKKAEVGQYLVSRGIFGSNLNTYTAVRYLSKLGELDAGPPTTRALGAEGAAKLIAKQAGLVLNVHQEIWRIRAELGYMPPVTVAGLR